MAAAKIAIGFMRGFVEKQARWAEKQSPICQFGLNQPPHSYIRFRLGVSRNH
ncbi:hypothetical protein [Cytobacillus sp. FSL H8-0458]|uniref:hypothetical protein n=1 Tax=Cytobacillus sp. FSL H8-0458 TaxID=2975346 RepID=UPI0030F94BA3